MINIGYGWFVLSFPKVNPVGLLLNTLFCSLLYMYVSESQITKVYLAFREDPDNIWSGFIFCRNSLRRLELTVGKSLCYAGELHPCFKQFVVCLFTAWFSSDAF